MSEPAEDCIPWIGYIANDGYGVIRVNGKVWRAHRLMYQRFYGAFNEELQVLHRCDNPVCINPHHLYLGTNNDNMKDKKKKGRARNQYTGGTSKLFDDIEDILGFHELGWSVIKIAEFYDTARSSIYSILKDYGRM